MIMRLVFSKRIAYFRSHLSAPVVFCISAFQQLKYQLMSQGWIARDQPEQQLVFLNSRQTADGFFQIVSEFYPRHSTIY